jgi:hypothetical protein
MNTSNIKDYPWHDIYALRDDLNVLENYRRRIAERDFDRKMVFRLVSKDALEACDDVEGEAEAIRDFRLKRFENFGNLITRHLNSSLGLNRAIGSQLKHSQLFFPEQKWKGLLVRQFASVAGQVRHLFSGDAHIQPVLEKGLSVMLARSGDMQASLRYIDVMSRRFQKMPGFDSPASIADRISYTAEKSLGLAGDFLEHAKQETEAAEKTLGLLASEILLEPICEFQSSLPKAKTLELAAYFIRAARHDLQTIDCILEAVDQSRESGEPRFSYGELSV